MKLNIVSTALALVALLGFSAPAHAAKGAKKGKGGASMIAHFDKNRDGTIDSTEGEKVRAAYTALKALDTDNNGELSDSEITAAQSAKAGKGKKGKRAGKKAGKGKKAAQ